MSTVAVASSSQLAVDAGIAAGAAGGNAVDAGSGVIGADTGIWGLRDGRGQGDAPAHVAGQHLRDRGGDAVRARVHVDLTEQGPVVSAEHGAEMDEVALPVRAGDGIHMSFGGVGVAARRADGGLDAAADPRRDGAAGVG